MSDQEVNASGSEGEEETPVTQEQTEEEPKEPTPPPAEPEPAPVQNNVSNSSGKKAKKTKRVQLNPPKEQPSKEEEPLKPVENNTEEGDEEDEEDEVKEEAAESAAPIDPAKILNAFKSVFVFFGGLLRKVFGFIQAFLLRVFDVTKGFLPITFAVGLFSAIVYAVGTYCMEEASGVKDFDERFQGIVRASVWANSSTVLALLMNRLRPHNIHKRFVQQSLEDSVILFFNSIVLATYADAECFHWVGVFYLVTSIYRLCLWTSQNYLSANLQYMFSAPVQLLHILLGLYNLYSIAAQDLGFLAPPPVEVAVETVAMEEEVAPGSTSWF